jgi:hypothetical protein
MAFEIDTDDDPLRIEAAAAAMASVMIPSFTVSPRIQGMILRRCAEICERQGAPANDTGATLRLLALEQGPETDTPF